MISPTIKISSDNKIIWPVFILGIFESFLGNKEIMFAVVLAFILLFWAFQRRIYFNTIIGTKPYFLMIAVMSVMGFLTYHSEIVVRDILYETAWFAVIILGTMFYRSYSSKSMLRTISLYLGCVSVYTILFGLREVFARGIEFSAFRSAFETNTYSISIVLAIMLANRIYYRKRTFEGPLENILMLLFAVQIILNLSRAAMMNVVLFIAAFAIFYLTRNRKISVFLFLRNLIVISAAVAALFVGFMKIIPDDVKETFLTKYRRTLVEIDDKNEYRDVYSALKDWRGYEIYSAQKQFKSYDVIEMVVGRGNGTAISVEYRPDYWGNIFEKQESGIGIGVLHNTYYTLLIKGGIIAVVLFIYFLLANVVHFFRKSKYEKLERLSIIMICLFIVYIFEAYVFRSFFSKDVDFPIMLLMGWLYCEIDDKENTDEESVEERIESE